MLLGVVQRNAATRRRADDGDPTLALLEQVARGHVLHRARPVLPLCRIGRTAGVRLSRQLSKETTAASGHLGDVAISESAHFVDQQVEGRRRQLEARDLLAQIFEEFLRSHRVRRVNSLSGKSASVVLGVREHTEEGFL